MIKEVIGGILFTCLCLGMFFFMGFITGLDRGIEKVKQQAIQNNCAYYDADEQGNALFTWGKK
jgi:hypothetical protein